GTCAADLKVGSKILGGVRRKMNKRGEVETVYKFGEKTNFGRLTTTSITPALQNICGETRGFLFEGILQDIDIHNCAPTIIHQLACHYGLEYPLLTEYIKDRAKVLDHLGMTKTDFFTAAFNKKCPPNFPAEYRGFHMFLYQVIVPKFKEMHPDVWEKTAPTHPNRQGSFLAYVYQCIECKILMHAKDFCCARGVEPAVLMFDGVMVRASEKVNGNFMDELSTYTFEKTGFKITWAEKPVTAPCAIPEEDEEEEEKTPEEQISEFIINEFKTKGYAKDADMIYVVSKANPYYYEPLMSVTEYASYILDEVFTEYFNKNARKYALYVNARLSHGSKNIRQYKPNRSLIAFKNGVLFTGTATNRQWGLFSLEDIAKDSEWFEKEICSGCPVAWNYIDNDFNFSVPRCQWTDMDIGPYRDVLELQMGNYPEAVKQYMMLAFGRSCFPVGALDNWRLCLITWGESGTGKTLTMDILKEIHGIKRMTIMEAGSKMTPYTLGYIREKPFWILHDVDRNVIQQVGQSLFKNASEGGGLNGAMKHCDEDTKQFETHIMMTLNYLVQFEEESDEISTRMVIAHFKNKPARKDDKIAQRIKSKYLINILVMGLANYHAMLDHLEEHPDQTLRDDVMCQYFKQSNEQARVLNDTYGKALFADELGLLVTKNPEDYIPLADIQRFANISPFTKWNDKLMET
ncbi:hypothetical protein GGF31_003482, partial [Allomyces arbusculus]